MRIKMQFDIFSAALLAIICLSACEGLAGGRGMVVTEKDGLPVDSAQVILYLNGHPTDTVYTDKSGRFLAKRFIGCLPKCPEPTLSIHKKGYVPVYLDFDQERAIDPDFHADSLKVLLVQQL